MYDYYNPSQSNEMFIGEQKQTEQQQKTQPKIFLTSISLKSKQMSAKRGAMTIKTMFTRKWVHFIAHKIGMRYISFSLSHILMELCCFCLAPKVESQWANNAVAANNTHSIGNSKFMKISCH